MDVVAEKTGKAHVFPVSSVLRRHLELMRNEDSGRVFPVCKTAHPFIRRELRKICDAAGVPSITPQAIRRCSVTEWTTISDAAGKLVHGEGLKVRSHYVRVLRVLQEHVARLPIPDEWKTEEERDALKVSQNRLIDQFSQLSEQDRVAVLALTEKLAS